MGWLPGWANTIKLTVDSSKVLADISDFPMLITLSSGSGMTGFDTTPVFDELGSYGSDLTTGKTHYSNNNYGAASNMADDDLGTYCQQMTYVSVSGVNAVVSKLRLAVHNPSARTQLIADEPIFEGSNNSTDGSDGDWFRITQITSGDVDLPGVYPGYVVDKEFVNNRVFSWYRLSGITNTTSNVYNEWEMFTDNRLKLAVTESNGTTQCYVEIEKWDNVAEEAFLWVKAPNLASASDTNFYLYYDSTQDNNTTYVGVVGDSPAQSVWDDNFTHVFHHAQDPSGGTDSFVDSTSAANHGDPTNMDSADLVESAVGDGYQYDTNEFIDNIGETNFSLVSGTVQFIMRQTYQDSNQGIWQVYTSDANRLLIWYFGTGSSHDHKIKLATGGGLQFDANTLPGTSEFEHWAVTYDFTNDDYNWFRNGVSDASSTAANTAPTAAGMEIGRYIFSGGGNYLYAHLDEFRISNTVRPFAWIKADYYSCTDDLVTFSDVSQYYSFSGYVYEENSSNPVSRTVRAYNRSTGALVASTTSSGDGYYYLQTSYSGTHYIVALDDDVGTQYNLAVLDRMVPVTVSG